jgi:Xaa-Pro aminopeptidase
MDSTFFSHNRKALLESLKKGALVVLTGYGEMQRTADSAAFFEQEANFWYLTGIESPDWWVILDGTHGTEWLVAAELSESQKIFDGSLTHEQAAERSGIKTVLTRDEAMRRLRDLSKHHSIAYTTEQPRSVRDHATFQLNHSQAELRHTLERIFQNVQLCNRELAILRTIKRPEEITAIQAAIDTTIKAFEAMKPVLATARHEYELEAMLGYEMRRRGARHAYDPIVASGLNACTLHYSDNSAPLRKRSLVLFDAGARESGYAADISRTYAIGTPSKRQKDVHQAVVEAQAECISLMKPGVTFSEYFERTDRIMAKALEAVKLSAQKYREYFPHALGHGLGIDVHDVLGGYHELRPGMVMTVEPGLYIKEEAIGVRIEDDILITETGHKNLSSRLSTDIS